MLYSVDSQSYVGKMPHERDYNVWMKKLGDSQYKAISDELQSRIGNGEVHTSSWIPGANWTGTAFEPIYTACGNNSDAAGKFFGLILFEMMMKDDKVWGFGRYPKNIGDIIGGRFFVSKKVTPSK